MEHNHKFQPVMPLWISSYLDSVYSIYSLIFPKSWTSCHQYDFSYQYAIYIQNQRICILLWSFMPLLSCCCLLCSGQKLKTVWTFSNCIHIFYLLVYKEKQLSYLYHTLPFFKWASVFMLLSEIYHIYFHLNLLCIHW